MRIKQIIEDQELGSSSRYAYGAKMPAEGTNIKLAEIGSSEENYVSGRFDINLDCNLHIAPVIIELDTVTPISDVNVCLSVFVMYSNSVIDVCTFILDKTTIPGYSQGSISTTLDIPAGGIIYASIDLVSTSLSFKANGEITGNINRVSDNLSNMGKDFDIIANSETSK